MAGNSPLFKMKRLARSVHDGFSGVYPMKSKCLDLILALMLVVVVVSGFATTWTQTPAAEGDSVGTSADGRVILAVPSTSHPEISTNWGQTWTTLTNTPSWGADHQGGVAMSADGRTIIATLTSNSPFQSWVFISTNYGVAWTRTDVLSSNIFGLVVACSGDATKLLAGIANGPICFSTNSGISWYPSSIINASQNEDWASVASCADGHLMAAVVNGGKLYFSTNFGELWVPTNLPALSWNSVCVSGDGNWVGVTGASGSYISSSAGASWITNKLNGQAIACSANGTNWIIGGGVASNSPVCTSSDGGVTWVTNLSTVTSFWPDAAISADGCEFIVTGVTGWVGRTTPSPQLNIQSTNGNASLSWLVPSTNFILQQSSDLAIANWVTVSNSPVLNLTNLQDEVSVPESATNGFFRLIAQ